MFCGKPELNLGLIFIAYKNCSVLDPVTTTHHKVCHQQEIFCSNRNQMVQRKKLESSNIS